jgi:hypothetical protein
MYNQGRIPHKRRIIMPRLSKSEVERRKLKAELERLAYDPDAAPTARARALSSLTTLNVATMRLEAERVRERREKAAAAASPYTRPSTLPDNGRGPPGW